MSNTHKSKLRFSSLSTASAKYSATASSPGSKNLGVFISLKYFSLCFQWHGHKSMIIDNKKDFLTCLCNLQLLF